MKVINFPRSYSVNTPESFLKECKENLIEEDYHDVLIAIMDKEYYEKIEEELQDIVDNYFSFL